jgi:hypothetical protein
MGVIVVQAHQDRVQTQMAGYDAMTATDKSIDFLRRALAADPKPVHEIDREARGAGLLSGTSGIGQSKPFREARRKLGIVVRKNGMRGGWSWSLPAQDAASDKKASASKAPFGSEDAVAQRNTPSHALGTFESAEPRSTPPEHPYSPALAALRAKCPEKVGVDRWQQAIRDAEDFLSVFGASAHRLGWTEGALFGLEPMRPSAAFRGRLAHPDVTGLLWHLRGRELGGISRTQATIRDCNGATSAVYCNNEIRPLR